MLLGLLRQTIAIFFFADGDGFLFLLIPFPRYLGPSVRRFGCRGRRLVWGGLVGCRRWLGLVVSSAIWDGLGVCSRGWFRWGGLPSRFSMLSAHALDLLFQAGLALLEVVILVL